jgi:hypothetical protein
MVQKPLQHGLHADHEEVHKNNSGSNIVEPRTCLHRVAMFKCIQSKQYFPASQDVQRKPLLPIRSCSFAPRVRCAPVMECMAPDASMTVEERAAAALRKVTVAKRTSPYLTSAAKYSGCGSQEHFEISDQSGRGSCRLGDLFSFHPFSAVALGTLPLDLFPPDDRAKG